MLGYWIRHRSIITICLCVAVTLISVFLFVFPQIEQQANNFNSQSIYKNSDVDFVVPEPSFEQVASLPGANGISAVYPFFMTKTQVKCNGATRTTTVLLSDCWKNLNQTMYNEKRLIEKSTETVENPIYVDWQFCQDSSAKIGDTLIIGIGGSELTFTVIAIYETNSIYEGGAIFAPINPEQKEKITQNSKNSGYSGMYVIASEYNTCKSYLTTDYRPLGRLKSRDQFESDEQYQVHYDAIMSSGYANEITDFRIKESSAESSNNPYAVLLTATVVAVIFIICNVIMLNRGCEKPYFAKFCIPKGKRVIPYYSISVAMELLLFFISYFAVLGLKIKHADIYIAKEILNYQVFIVPFFALVGEAICRIINGKAIKSIPVKKEQVDN